MLSSSVILSALTLAAAESGIAATLMAFAALVTALSTAGGVLVAASKHRANLARIRISDLREREREREEHGRTVERLERITERYADLQITVSRMESKLEEKEARVEELEWKADDQAKQLTTMHNILSDIGTIIREDGIKSARLETVYSQFALVQTRFLKREEP